MSPHQQSGNCCRFEILQARRNCATARSRSVDKLIPGATVYGALPDRLSGGDSAAGTVRQRHDSSLTVKPQLAALWRMLQAQDLRRRQHAPACRLTDRRQHDGIIPHKRIRGERHGLAQQIARCIAQLRATLCRAFDQHSRCRRHARAGARTTRNQRAAKQANECAGHDVLHLFIRYSLTVSSGCVMNSMSGLRALGLCARALIEAAVCALPASSESLSDAATIAGAGQLPVSW